MIGVKHLEGSVCSVPPEGEDGGNVNVAATGTIKAPSVI